MYTMGKRQTLQSKYLPKLERTRSHHALVFFSTASMGAIPENMGVQSNFLATRISTYIRHQLQ